MPAVFCFWYAFWGSCEKDIDEHAETQNTKEKFLDFGVIVGE